MKPVKLLTDEANQTANALVPIWMAKMLGAANGRPHEALALADGLRAPSGAVHFMKSAITATGTVLTPELGATPVLNAFASALGSSSAFAMMHDMGLFVRPDFNQRFAAASAGLTAYEVAEGRAVGMSALAMDSQALAPSKVGALIALTRESWMNSTPGGINLVDQLIRDALAAKLDAALFTAVGAGVTISAAGDDLAQVRSMLLAMLTHVNRRANSRLAFALSPSAASALSLYPELGTVSPSGRGTLLQLPCTTTDALGEGELALINGNAVAANLGGLEFATSENATLQMLDTDVTIRSDTAVPASVISMFQANSVALRMVQAFGVEALSGTEPVVYGEVALS